VSVPTQPLSLPRSCSWKLVQRKAPRTNVVAGLSCRRRHCCRAWKFKERLTNQTTVARSIDHLRLFVRGTFVHTIEGKCVRLPTHGIARLPVTSCNGPLRGSSEAETSYDECQLLAQSGHSRHRNILSAIGVTADIEQPLLSNLSRPTRGCTLKGSVSLSFDRGQCVTARRSAAIFLNRASPVWVS
jgi:hypothetical protein